MINALAVSTFNARGLADYGYRMVQSFHDRWSMGVPLRVYSEGWVNGNLPCEDLDLHEVSPWLRNFKKRHATFDPGPGYRRDAVRFAHKVAALTHAATGARYSHVIWLDGDVFTHSDFNEEDLEGLLPTGNEWIAWLDRDKHYPECGFYILNCEHPRHAEYLLAFERMYSLDLLFKLKEFHDSYVLEQVVKILKIETKSLSGEAGRPTHHPLINGPLGKWFDHLKGQRKSVGVSLKRDLTVKRDESYWDKLK